MSHFIRAAEIREIERNSTAAGTKSVEWAPGLGNYANAGTAQSNSIRAAEEINRAAEEVNERNSKAADTETVEVIPGLENNYAADDRTAAQCNTIKTAEVKKTAEEEEREAEANRRKENFLNEEFFKEEGYYTQDRAWRDRMLPHTNPNARWNWGKEAVDLNGELPIPKSPDHVPTEPNSPKLAPVPDSCVRSRSPEKILNSETSSGLDSTSGSAPSTVPMPSASLESWSENAVASSSCSALPADSGSDSALPYTTGSNSVTGPVSDFAKDLFLNPVPDGEALPDLALGYKNNIDREEPQVGQKRPRPEDLDSEDSSTESQKKKGKGKAKEE